MRGTTKERVHTLKADFAIEDFHRFYNRTNPDNKLPYKKYSNIITDFNEGIIESMIETGLWFYMPTLGFELIIRKDKRKPKIVNGKLINNVPVDWYRTKQLWADDEQAKEQKKLVRFNNSHTAGYVFRIYCKKFKSHIKNKELYKFKPSRKFQRLLSTRIKDPDKDNFDAFLLY